MQQNTNDVGTAKKLSQFTNCAKAAFGLLYGNKQGVIDLLKRK